MKPTINKYDFVQYLLQLGTNTVLISAPLLLGYAIGTVIAVSFFMLRVDPTTGYGTDESWLFYISHDVIDFRYVWHGEYNYDGSAFHASLSDLPLQSVFLTVFMVFSASTIISIFANRAPLLLASISISNTPDHGRIQVRKLWRAGLRTKCKMTIKKTIFLLGLGFTGAWVGLFMDLLRDKWHYELYLRDYRVIPYTMPEPIFGWFTASDIVWLVLALLGFAYFTTIRPARRRLAASKPLARRWCKDCGYPIGTIKSTEPIKVCPECGNESS